MIGGSPVTFKATGGLAYRYKAQFGREYLEDAALIENSVADVPTPKKTATKKEQEEYANKIAYRLTANSLELIYNILWCMAKAADSSIPDPQTWLDSFDEFPVYDIWDELQDIMNFNLSIAPKNA